MDLNIDYVVPRQTLAVLALGVVLLSTGCGGGDSAEPSGERGGRPAAEAGREGGPPSGAPRSGDGSSKTGGATGGGPPGGPGGLGGMGGAPEERGVPVRLATVGRGSIADFFETQGALEAENEVDLVARVGGPVIELLAEEGMRVEKGHLLARIDDRELQAQLAVSEVRLDETRRTYERVKALHDRELVSQEALDQGLAAYQSARGDFERTQVQLDYTRITAPFTGLIVERYIKLAEHVANGAQLFRLSDFDPLLCRIQVPEGHLSSLAKGQRAELTVEAWKGERFVARVLRVSPVVDADTGTVRVTLEVEGGGRLRPGMYANIYLEMERRDDVLVVPRDALALDSLGDTVFVAADGVAQRRSLELGLRNDVQLEVLVGLEEGERVVVVGQDGLSDGTPIESFEDPVAPAAVPGPADGSEAPGASEPRVVQPPAGGPPTAARGSESPRSGDRPAGFGGGFPGGPRGGGIDLDDPAQVERIRRAMKMRGLTDEQIDQRLEEIRERTREGGPAAGRGPGGSGGGV